MIKLRNILTVLLAVAIATAGIPVQAGQGCCVGAKTQMMMKDCKDCLSKTGHQKNKSCDGDCVLGCSSLNSMNVFPATSEIAVLFFTRTSMIPFARDSALTSHFPQTQERPPKYLS